MTGPNDRKFNTTKTGMRLEEVYDRRELSQMTDVDKLKLRAIVEDGVQRPCPGVPGGDFCGNEREETGGYCTSCRKAYQRAKYRERKLRAHPTNPNNVYKPTKTTQPNCNCCGTFDAKTLGVIEGIIHPPICEQCHGFFADMLERFPSRQILSILRFAMAQPQLIDRMEYVEEKHERIVKALYDSWYREQVQMTEDLRRMGNTDIGDPDPSEFRINKDEYNRLAQKWGYNDVFERPLMTFEHVNRAAQ